MNRPKAGHPVACTPTSAVGINGTEFAHLKCNGSGKAGVEDETECSSSFEDSDSGVENPGSDSEVASYVEHNSTSDLAMGFGDFLRMRRKKLTLQWRTYIQPFMWRCKWLELQIKNCNAQASKYDRELAAYNARKLFPTDNFNQEGFCVKSLPFSNDLPRDKIMRRMKRRKIEKMEDIAPYMLNHNLFSYEGKHTRGANGSNGARMDDDLGIEKINVEDELEVSDTLWLQSWNGNVKLETMLRELDSLQSKVKNLRSRMFKVKRENAEIFSLADELDSLVASANELSSPVRSLASPSTSGVIIPEQSPNNEPELPSQNDSGDGVRVSGDQSNQHDKCMKVKEEDDDMEEAKMQPIRKSQVVKSLSHETLSNVVEEPDRDNDDQHAPKTRSIAKLIAPKGRKKRGKRKGSSSRWSRRSYG